MADEDSAEGATAGARGGILHAAALGCAIALALGGLGAAAWRGGLLWPAPRPQVTPAAAAVRPGALEPLDPFIANLSDEDGRRYLKATLQVEFFDAVVPREFNAHMPQVRDMLITLFGAKTFADVRTPEGKAVLREEIVNRLNVLLAEDAVKAVYFTEFIIQ